MVGRLLRGSGRWTVATQTRASLWNQPCVSAAIQAGRGAAAPAGTAQRCSGPSGAGVRNERRQRAGVSAGIHSILPAKTEQGGAPGHGGMNPSLHREFSCCTETWPGLEQGRHLRASLRGQGTGFVPLGQGVAVSGAHPEHRQCMNLPADLPDTRPPARRSPGTPSRHGYTEGLQVGRVRPPPPSPSLRDGRLRVQPGILWQSMLGIPTSKDSWSNGPKVDSQELYKSIPKSKKI